MSELTDAKRDEIEKLIYKTFDAADPTKANTEYYMNLFSGMSNSQFYKFLSKKLPFRFHSSVFKNEPTMSDIFAGFKVLNKPLMEKVKLPYLYKDSNGKPIESKECLVIYINIKRMKQFQIKKTNTAIDINKRDITGRLVDEDKGGLESDKEFEGGAALGLENTIIENARVRADAMNAKSEAYNHINITGEVSLNDINADKTDSLAKNIFNVYLIGANMHSNLVDSGYMTPYTMENRKKNLERE